MWRCSRSIAEVRSAFASGALSPVELLESCLSACEATASLRAFTWVEAGDRLRRRAEESHRRWSKGEPAGPLDGIPVSIKVEAGNLAT